MRRPKSAGVDKRNVALWKFPGQISKAELLLDKICGQEVEIDGEMFKKCIREANIEVDKSNNRPASLIEQVTSAPEQNPDF